MSGVFLDTVGMIAVWDDTDQWHQAAKLAYQILLEQGRRLLTTPLVLYECGNASARRPYRGDVCELRRALAQEGLLVEPSERNSPPHGQLMSALRRPAPGSSITFRSR